MEISDIAFAARLVAIPLALTIDPFAPLLVLGIALRIGWIHDPILTRPEFVGFTDPLFLGSVGVLYVLHVLADKVPVFGHLFDAIGLVAKPLAGVMIGLWITQKLDPSTTLHWVAIAVVLFGGLPAALGLQAARTKVRMAASASSGGLLHPVTSTVETAVGLPIAFLAVDHPLLALAVVTLIVVPTLWLFQRLLRTANRTVRRAADKIRNPRPVRRASVDHAKRFP